jgi:hypothetical protein
MADLTFDTACQMHLLPQLQVPDRVHLAFCVSVNVYACERECVCVCACVFVVACLETEVGVSCLSFESGRQNIKKLHPTQMHDLPPR